jgi:hypothetical protein
MMMLFFISIGYSFCSLHNGLASGKDSTKICRHRREFSRIGCCSPASRHGSAI